MLMMELMCEAAKRYGSGPGLGAVVGDAGDQARHGMDAPDEVQDGMEWYADEDDHDIAGPAPRMVALREPLTEAYLQQELRRLHAAVEGEK